MKLKLETTTQSGFARKRAFLKIWKTLDNRNIQSVILDLVEELFSNPFSVLSKNQTTIF